MKKFFRGISFSGVLVFVFFMFTAVETNAAVASYRPGEAVMEYGNVCSGSVSDLYYDDESYFATGSSTSPTYRLAWRVKWNIHIDKSAVGNVTITYKGKCSTDDANDEYISLFNFELGIWQVVIQRPVSEEDITSVWTTSNIEDLEKYISPDGQVRGRIYNSAPSWVGAFERYTDYFELKVEYTPTNSSVILTPNNVTMEYGTVESGTAFDLKNSDGNFFAVNSDAQHRAAWWTSWDTNLDRNTVTAMTVVYKGKWSTETNPLWLSFWNWDTEKWQVVLTFPSSPTNKKWVWTGDDWDDINHFISDSGEIRCRLYNSAPSWLGSFQRFGDYLAVHIEYGTASAFTFAVIADVHHSGKINYDPLVTVVNDINNRSEVEFVINNGDTASYSKEEEFDAYLYDIAALNAAIYESPGNHDVRWYCSNGLNDFRNKMNQQGYIMFDYKETRIIVLDTSVFMENDGAIEPYLLEWVENSLNGLSTDIPIILFGHHPDLNLPLRRELVKILEDYNVKIFFGGHRHIWNYEMDNGVIWAVVNDVKSGKDYALVSVTPTHIKVRKRDAANNVTTDWLSIPRVKKTNNSLTVNCLVVDQETGTVNLSVQTETALRKIDKVEARARGYAAPVELVESSSNIWTGTIDISSYVPTMPKGKHFVEVVATDIDGNPWTVYEEYEWTSSRIDYLWEFATGGSIQAPPTHFNGKVYFGSNNGNIYAVDVETGELSWVFATGGEVISQPAVYDGQNCHLVITGSADNNLYALDADSGNLVWFYTTGGAVLSSPLVEEGKVYFGSGDKKIYCLEAGNGLFNWSYQTEGLMRQRPVVYNGTLYTVVRDMKLWYAININDGALKWLKDADAGNSWMPVCDNSPVVVNNCVWVVKPDYTFSTLHTETGNITWTYSGPEQFSARGAVALGNKVFNASRNDVVFAWNSNDKTQAWQTDLKQDEFDIQYKGVNSAMVAEDGKIYRISARGRVNCLDAETGEILWEGTLSGLPEINFWSTPHIHGNYFFAGGLDGKLYAVEIVIKK